MGNDLLNLLINFSSLIDPAITLTVSVSALVGVMMIWRSLMNAYLLSQDGTRWGPNPPTVTGTFSSLFIGGVLVAPVYFIQISGNTLLNVSVNSSNMLYQSSGLSPEQQAALQAIFGLFTFAGLIAFVRGWIVLDKHWNGVIRDGVPMGLTFILGGTCLIYLEVALDLLREKAGIDFANMLLF